VVYRCTTSTSELYVICVSDQSTVNMRDLVGAILNIPNIRLPSIPAPYAPGLSSFLHAMFLEAAEHILPLAAAREIATRFGVDMQLRDALGIDELGVSDIAQAMSSHWHCADYGIVLTRNIQAGIRERHDAASGKYCARRLATHPGGRPTRKTDIFEVSECRYCNEF